VVKRYSRTFRAWRVFSSLALSILDVIDLGSVRTLPDYAEALTPSSFTMFCFNCCSLTCDLATRLVQSLGNVADPLRISLKQAPTSTMLIVLSRHLVLTHFPLPFHHLALSTRDSFFLPYKDISRFFFFFVPEDSCSGFSPPRHSRLSVLSSWRRCNAPFWNCQESLHWSPSRSASLPARSGVNCRSPCHMNPNPPLIEREYITCLY